jgi:signal transduction histidine kinase
VSWEFWSFVAIALCDLTLGVIVLWHAPRSWYKFFFFLVTLGVTGWCSSIAFFSIGADIPMALFLARLMFLCEAFIPVSFYFFARTFPKVSRPVKIRELIVSLTPPLVFSLLLFGSDLLVHSVTGISTQTHQRVFFGPALLFYCIYYFSYILLSMEILWKRLSTLDGLERLQTLYVLQSFSFSMILVGLTNILLPLFNINTFVALGPYFTLIFVGGITYAILKYRLMNIEVVVKRSIIYAMVIGCIITAYLLLILTLDSFFKTGIIANNAALIVLVAAVTFTAVSFSSLEEWFQRVTDRIFFKGKYDYREFLRHLEKTVAGIIELDKLLGQVSVILQRTIKTDKVFFFIYQKETASFIYKNLLVEQSILPALTGKNPLLKFMTANRRIAVLHELRAKAARAPKLHEVAEEMRQLGCYVCIPLMSRNALLGILCLGRKLSGDIYTAEDIVLFETFNYQLSTALENAYLHQEALNTQEQIAKTHRLTTIGTMTAGIAHEIKNPMVALKTFTEILPKKFDDPAFRKKYMEIVPKEVERINNLLESLLALSRPAALEMQKVEVSSVINELEQLLQNKIEQSNIILTLEVKDKVVIKADRVQLGQALLNLLLNAIQFMPQGGCLTIRIGSESDKAVISIQDTGVGILAENLPRLFDPFFTTRNEGTGLGLSITQKIIEEHKGKIEVTSKVGKGTVFTLRFPLA